MEFFKRDKSPQDPTKHEFNYEFVHNKSFQISLASILIILLLLVFVPFAFDNSGLKFKIEQKVGEVLKANLEIKGDITVAIFPIPAITAENVFLQNHISGEKTYNFYAKKIKINAGFFSFLIGEFKVKKIIIFSGVLENYYTKNLLVKRDDLFTKALEQIPHSDNKVTGNDGFTSRIFDINDINFSRFSGQNSPSVVVKNSVLASYDINSFKNEITQINGKINFAKKKISGNLAFVNQNILNEFEIKARFDSEVGQNNSFIKLSSPFGVFKITGSFTTQNNGLLTSNFIGDFAGEIYDLKNFYKSYISSEGLIYNKINPNAGPIKIKADLINSSGEIRVSNLAINSNYINGSGYAIIDVLRNIPTADLDLDLENINFDAVWLADKNIASKEEKPQEVPAIDMSADATKMPIIDDQNATINLTKDFRNFDISAEIKVKNINYLDEEIKNLELYVTIAKMGQVLILPLTLELPDKGLVRMNGAIENNGQVKFLGKIYINGQNLNDVFKWLKFESQNLKYDNLKDYLLYSDVMITPHYTRLNNLYFNVNNAETEMLGEAKIDYSAKTSSIISNFEVSAFNFDNYFLTSNQNAYLSVGELLKKLLWLNNISTNNDASFHFENLTYNNLNFKDQSLKMRFGQGYFEITELKLKSDEFDLSALLAVDISGKQPKLDLSLSSNNFSYTSKQNNADGKINAIDQFFSLPSLDGFDGTIFVDIKNAKLDNLDLNNIAIDGKFKDGIIEFSKFKSDIYGGNLEYKGSLGIKFDKNFSGNLNFNNVSLKPLLKDLFGLRDVDGKANITSSITAIASNKNDFRKNLISEVNIGASGVTIDGYGLNDLVKKMFNVKNYKDDLQNPEKILFNNAAETTLQKVVGTASLGRGNENKFKFDFEALAVNGILSGKIDLAENSIDALANVIFLTGNRTKQTPINVASSLKGPLDNFLQSTNMGQVRQYLGLSIDAQANSNMLPTPSVSESNLSDKTQNLGDNMPATLDAASQKQVDATLKDVNNISNTALEAARKAQEQLKQNQAQENAK